MCEWVCVYVNFVLYNVLVRCTDYCCADFQFATHMLFSVENFSHAYTNRNSIDTLVKKIEEVDPRIRPMLAKEEEICLHVIIMTEICDLVIGLRKTQCECFICMCVKKNLCSTFTLS